MRGRNGRASGLVVALALAVTLLFERPACAQKAYDVGASDTEIKIGNIVAYSGPVSSVSVIAKVEAAYFNKMNNEGGIHGRKIKFISYDDAYSPPKTVEQARKLVEGDEVLLLFNPVGTPTNAAIQKYMNSKKVPHLFLGTGGSRWNDPQNFPWTMGWNPTYQSEGRIYAKYLLGKRPEGKIAVMYQNDDLGKDYLKGLKEGLGDKASLIIAEESYEAAEPSIDAHIVKLKATGADVFVLAALPKAAAQSIRKVSEIGWKPLFILSNVGSSISATVGPAGFDKAQGVISTALTKDVGDPQWDNDEGMRIFKAFMAGYAPELDKNDNLVVYGYILAQALVRVLEQCGDNLTRANVMREAANLRGFTPNMLLPGISVNTSPSDYVPLKELRIVELKGERWELVGDVISSSP